MRFPGSRLFHGRASDSVPCSIRRGLGVVTRWTLICCPEPPASFSPDNEGHPAILWALVADLSPFLGCPPAFPADGRRGCGHPGPPVVDTWVALPEARGASALPHGSPNGPWRPEASDLVGTAKPGRGPLGLGSCSLGPRLSRGGQSLLEGTRFGRSKAGAQRPHDAIQEHLLKSTENEVITLDADWAPMVCMAHASCWQHQADTWPLPTALPFASSQGSQN